MNKSLMKRFLEVLLYGPGITFMSWFLLSYLEVVCKNLSGYPLTDWNFFSVFM